MADYVTWYGNSDSMDSSQREDESGTWGYYLYAGAVSARTGTNDIADIVHVVGPVIGNHPCI